MKNSKSYEIGIRGHDISRSRVVRYQGSLIGAKRRATTEFGDGFLHHEILIVDASCEELVSRRGMSDRRWRDVE